MGNSFARFPSKKNSFARVELERKLQWDRPFCCLSKHRPLTTLHWMWMGMHSNVAVLESQRSTKPYHCVRLRLPSDHSHYSTCLSMACMAPSNSKPFCRPTPIELRFALGLSLNWQLVRNGKQMLQDTGTVVWYLSHFHYFVLSCLHLFLLFSLYYILLPARSFKFVSFFFLFCFSLAS